MNCKIGDLAIIVGPTRYKHHIGKIVELKKIYTKGIDYGWLTEPIFNTPAGAEIVWKDAHLRPIRDQPGKDESLQWCPTPGQKDKVPA